MRLVRASVSSTREADEARVTLEQRTGLRECRQSGGAFHHEFTQIPVAKHASFSGSLVAEVSSLCISSVCFDNAGLPATKSKGRALGRVIKEGVAIRVFLRRSLFGVGILRRFLLRVSLAKPTSAALRF